MNRREWSTFEPPVEETSTAEVADVLTKQALRSDGGVRVTLSDTRGEPVVSVWALSAGTAWNDADTLDGLRRHNPDRLVDFDKWRAS